MHLSSIVLALAVGPLAAFASNVLEADAKTFSSLLGDTPSLVEFYAPWCGHCKNLAPIYEQLADAFSSSKDKVKIVKVDADGEGKELGQKYGVTGFPTLKWFPGGANSEPEEYDGGRTLMPWYKKKPEPKKATRQLDLTSFKKIALDPTKNALVAFTASWCGHCKAMKPTLEKVAKNFENEEECIVADLDADTPETKPLAQEYGVSGFPTIKFFPKGVEQTPLAYEIGRSEADFTEFLNKHCGTHRAVDGGLNDAAGRVAALDILASRIYAVVPASRSQIYDEAVVLSKALGSSADYYLRVMKKLVNSTEDYVSKEAKRLATILEKKTLSSKKLDEIKVKANILAAFLEQDTPRRPRRCSSISRRSCKLGISQLCLSS
ncbi:protein disulfide isomerase [Cantharellus anzutake]|uniref:protein disulfide isomerase n=1 Tax=Cantharellus anzutake TaxID=1750568 RepID=UPI00190828B6|nr:protein disulfide isomerase [Cantharellus anzutake]KAF8340496.1 protein disulfide isomerase [Cantharellus anzutake]